MVGHSETVHLGACRPFVELPACLKLPRNGLLGDYSCAAAVRHADLWLTDSAAGILISVAVEDLELHD
jgi:hypothetical protein